MPPNHSFQWLTMENRVMVAMEAMAKGSMMRVMMTNSLAPSMEADSLRLLLCPMKKFIIIIT